MKPIQFIYKEYAVFDGGSRNKKQKNEPLRREEKKGFNKSKKTEITCYSLTGYLLGFRGNHSSSSSRYSLSALEAAWVAT